MKAIRFFANDGKEYEIWQPRIDTAFEFIRKRLERSVPVETIEAEKLKSIVAGLDVDVQRPITPTEANQMVSTIKEYIIGEIESAKKFYVSEKESENERLKNGS